MKRFIKFVFAAMVAGGGCTLMSIGATYANSEWQTEDMARARLVSAQTATNGDQTVLLGLQIELKKGWKTYWRTPGDSGLPPHFEWTGSDNFQTAEVKWPRPDSFDSFGLQTWGYAEEILLPIQVSLKNPSKPLDAKLTVSYGVCEQVCVPIRQEFTVHLAADEAEPSMHSELIRSYEAKVPQRISDESSVHKLIVIAENDKKMRIEATSRVGFDKPQVILEGENGDFYNVEDVEISADRHSVTFGVGADVVNRDLPLQGRKLVVTLLDRDIAVEGHRKVK